MRSGLIFAISEKISNRYMLCRMLAASARKMHRDGVSISQSINRSLQVLHHPPVQQPPQTIEAVEAGNPEADKEPPVLVP